jgi:hypothetical protein
MASSMTWTAASTPAILTHRGLQVSDLSLAPTWPWAHFTDGLLRPKGGLTQHSREGWLKPPNFLPFPLPPICSPCKSWGQKFAQPTMAPL